METKSQFGGIILIIVQPNPYNKYNRVLLSWAVCVIGSLGNLMFKPSYNIKFPWAAYHTIVSSTEEPCCLISIYQTSGWCFSHALIGYSSSGIAFAIHLPAFFWISRVSFASFLRNKKKLFGTGYPLVCHILKTIIHLSVGEEW